jgi:energy-coupling factor transporter ATP-binding protein EcfA2
VALQAINQARFQDMVNHLLHIQGYKFIGAPGSVVGKEKTSKGAPDSFFEDGQGYAFVECTTLERVGKSQTFFSKLNKDIDHCFDKDNHGIAPQDITKVILACTEKISPKEHKELKARVEKHNSTAKLEVLDIQNLPMHIYDFPGLSQYTGVSITKGEIYNLPDFLQKTTKGLQPSLINDFVGRETDLKDAQQHLEEVDVLLLSGPAGVGKSKLAVSLLEKVAEKKGCIPIVIQSSAVPLWDDFVNLFQNGKDYIILFDDANKSVQNLSYLLDYLKRPRTAALKVVITSRDYAKQLVQQKMGDTASREMTIITLSDQQIGDIILAAVPGLGYRGDIKRKIVELAKGNARMALMAAYSVTEGAQTNYLDSPVQLYEKYFQKIAEEIQAFSKPIMLQAIAIVSFFGVLNRRDAAIAKLLKENFTIDWDDLWAAIMELHTQEILDVYADEIVKASDQVLATYAFYKCFIDEGSAVINYGQWIAALMDSYPHRIKTTLVDANNTFNYYHVKDLVLPHLQQVLEQVENPKLLYSFHSLFWFYKGRSSLLYIAEWVDSLPLEAHDQPLAFTFVHNDHTEAGAYFELLVGFWDHGNELLVPAIELGIDMVARQPSRLQAFLKFLNDHFSYKMQDLHHGYARQIALLEALSNESRSDLHSTIAKGAFLNIAEVLLGWSFTEFAGTAGPSFNIFNFELFNSPSLLELRAQAISGLDRLFDFDQRQSAAILNRIVRPGAKIDRNVYISELPLYEALIDRNLSIGHLSHCKFVKRLANHLKAQDSAYPKAWDRFIDSELMQLSRFLKTDFEDRKGKTWQQREEEKRQEIQEFLDARTWPKIAAFLISTDALYRQQEDHDRWSLEQAITEIFIGIAIKGKAHMTKALKMYFSGQFSAPLNYRVLNNILNRNVLSAKELLKLIKEHDFNDKEYWVASLLIAMPQEQIDLPFTKLLLHTFEATTITLPIHRMSDLLKYGSMFDRLKLQKNKKQLHGHNIITYLTQVALANKASERVGFGLDFCQECGIYFTEHPALLGAAYSYLKNKRGHFDHDGEELAAVLEIDPNFFVEHIQAKISNSAYLRIKMDHYKLGPLWSLPNYNRVIAQCLEMILAKMPVFSSCRHPAAAFFINKQEDEGFMQQQYAFIENYIELNHSDKQSMLMIMNVVLHKFNSRFIAYLRQFLLLNKDISILKSMFFEKFQVYTGSRVPYIQNEIEFCQQIIAMVNTLPGILSYSAHLDYLEKMVVSLRKEIADEQQRDFQEFYS